MRKEAVGGSKGMREHGKAMPGELRSGGGARGERWEWYC